MDMTSWTYSKNLNSWSYLGGEDVAGWPGDLGSELQQGLDEDRGLDGHVQASGDTGSLQIYTGLGTPSTNLMFHC